MKLFKVSVSYQDLKNNLHNLTVTVKASNLNDAETFGLLEVATQVGLTKGKNFKVELVKETFMEVVNE